MARTTANSLSESPCGFVPHRSRIKKVGLQVAANVASNDSAVQLVKFYKRVAGVSTLLAMWNTHTSAQGAAGTLNTAAPAVMSSLATGLVTNSDAEIAANAGLTYEVVASTGGGQAMTAQSVFTIWLEEI
jgi:hypothetical protein